MTDLDHSPSAHYDRVTEAWRLLLGEELHYGVFDSPATSLPEATAALTSRMVDGAQLAAGLRVLDVGCGTGAPACRLARDHGVGVVGITTSTVGVDRAEQRARDEGVADRVEFRIGDGMDNRLPAASFDRVWVLESSHLMPDRTRLFTECARVMRPGARLVWCDLIRRREIPFLELRQRATEFATLREAFGSARMDPLEDYRAIAETTGLTVDALEDLTDATLPTFAAWRANATEHGDEVQALIGRPGLDAFVASTDILEAMWRDGTLGYGLMAAQRPVA